MKAFQGRTFSIIFKEMVALIFAIFTAVVTVGQLLSGLDSILHEEKEGYTSTRTKKFFAFSFIGSWGLLLVIFLLCFAAKVKIQWEIKQHQEDKKTKDQQETDVEAALGLLGDQKKFQQKDLKRSGTRNRLLNKISNQLTKRNKLEKKKLKVYKETEKNKMEAIKKAQNLNDLNFSILMNKESEKTRPRKKRGRSQ